MLLYEQLGAAPSYSKSTEETSRLYLLYPEHNWARLFFTMPKSQFRPDEHIITSLLYTASAPIVIPDLSWLHHCCHTDSSGVCKLRQLRATNINVLARPLPRRQIVNRINSGYSHSVTTQAKLPSSRSWPNGCINRSAMLHDNHSQFHKLVC